MLSYQSHKICSLTRYPDHIVFFFLKALKNLAQHKPNRSIMKNELGMLESLRAIMHRYFPGTSVPILVGVHSLLSWLPAQH